MQLKNILILFVAFTFWCCNSTNEKDYKVSEVINADPSEVKEFVTLSEIADSVICIKLQCDSLDVIGKAREIVIRDKYIYVQDIAQQCIFVFDKQGRFVSQLAKKGEGPDEYVWLGPFYIDEEEQSIDIIDKGPNPSMLKKYTIPDSRFLGESPIANISFNSSKRKDSCYYFATQQIDNVINDKKTNADLIIWNDRKKYARSVFEKEIETGHSSFCPNIESFVQNGKGELFVSMMYDNTFYRLEEDSVIPVYTIDFGHYNMDNSIGNKSLNEQLAYIERKSRLAFFPVLTMNDEDIMAFSYYFKGDGDRFFREEDFRQYIRFKKNGKVIHAKKIKNDLTSFPDYMYVSSYFFDCIHEVRYKNYLVDIIHPYYYLKKRNANQVFTDKIGEVTAEDNPIIIMVKLKSELLNE